MSTASKPGVTSSRPDATSTNEIVRQLPGDSRHQLVSHATRVSTRKDQVLYDATVDTSWSYLPCSGLVSLQASTEDGDAVEIAMVGRESVVGFAPGMATPRPIYRAVVSVPGEMLRVRAAVLLEEFERLAATRHVLLASWSLCLADIAQNAACRSFHSAEQRLARWLLSAADRTDLARFRLTQEDLAQRLGLYRTGITQANLALQDARAIRVRHGRIGIIDRARLEIAACECYRLTRR